MADGRVGGDPGEGVAAAALQTDDQVGGGTGHAPAAGQDGEPLLGRLHDRGHHLREAVVPVVLQAHEVLAAAGAFPARRKEPVGLQLLTAEADDQHFAAEVRVQREVAERADGDRCAGGVDRHPASVGVLERHHVVDTGVPRQQLPPDAFGGDLHRRGHALHGRGEGQDIARAHGAVGVGVALEGESFECWLGRGHGGGQRKLLQLRRRRDREQLLADPCAAREAPRREADRRPVAQDRGTRGDVVQGDLVRLRHGFLRHEAIGEPGADGKALGVDDDADVVSGVDADVAGIHRRPVRA